SMRALALRAETRGTFSKPEARGVLAASGVRSGELPPAEVRVPFELSAGVARVDQAPVDVAGGRVELVGRARVFDDRGKVIAAPNVDAELAISNLAIGPLSQDRARGLVFGTARFEGTLQNYVARAELDAKKLVVEGTTIAVSRIFVEGNEESLKINPVRIT